MVLTSQPPLPPHATPTLGVSIFGALVVSIDLMAAQKSCFSYIRTCKVVLLLPFYDVIVKNSAIKMESSISLGRETNFTRSPFLFAHS